MKSDPQNLSGRGVTAVLGPTNTGKTHYAIERMVSLARASIQIELDRLNEANARCRATTRKGKACQRTPLPDRDYCPSHQHLERSKAAA